MTACGLCGQRVPDGSLVCQRGHRVQARPVFTLREARLARVVERDGERGLLLQELFDSARHPRGRAGKFARSGRVADRRPLPDEFDALSRTWGDLEEQIDDRTGREDEPETQALIERQKAVQKAMHHVRRGMATPGTSGVGVHDLVVVGGGPGGLASAGYGASEGLDTVLLEAAPRVGGQIKGTTAMENTPGFGAGVSGPDFIRSTRDATERLGADVRTGQRVIGLELDPNTGIKTVRLEDGSAVRGRTVIIAGGVKFRKLNAKGEQPGEFRYGDGVGTAAAADGKDVIVAGGGNSAAQAARRAAKTARSVTILLHRGSLSDKASDYLVRPIEANPKITVANGSISEVEHDGDGNLTGVILADGSRLPAQVVAPFIGAVPSPAWSSLQTDERNRIVVDGNRETSMPGVFAVGDVSSDAAGRVGAAVGDAAHALVHVHQALAARPSPQMHLFEARKRKDAAPVKQDAADDLTDRIFDFAKEWPYTGGDVEPPQDFGENEVLEARAAGDVRTRFDAMEEGALRRHIGKMKAMGDRAPAGALIRANQALARKLALRESWEEWDEARKAHHFSKAMKSGPMPGTWKDSPGRGPEGNIRNFKAMSPAKLTETLKALALHGEDPEAHKAAMAAAAEKLGVFDGDTIKVPKELAGKSASGQLLIS